MILVIVPAIRITRDIGIAIVLVLVIGTGTGRVTAIMFVMETLLVKAVILKRALDCQVYWIGIKHVLLSTLKRLKGFVGPLVVHECSPSRGDLEKCISRSSMHQAMIRLTEKTTGRRTQQASWVSSSL